MYVSQHIVRCSCFMGIKRSSPSDTYPVDLDDMICPDCGETYEVLKGFHYDILDSEEEIAIKSAPIKVGRKMIPLKAEDIDYNLQLVDRS